MPSRILAFGFAGIGLWAVVPAVAGWRTPPQVHDLRFPFEEGRYLVANGGSSERINGHFMTLAPRYRRWRGESYAVDLIRVDSLGFRTIEKRPFYTPRDPRAYLTFGTPVHSPCAGIVEAADNSRPDMPVPIRDRQQLEGNFVRLRCAGMVVLLGHFRKGGVLVNAGQTVRAGQRLGFIGNSGNTDEPHLHIHAQTPGTANEPLSRDPVAISFEGRFPVRNMVFGPR